MTDDTAIVQCSVDGSVARLTLNRPQKRNALNAEIIRELSSHLVQLAQVDSVRVVTITGAGTDFCSGADLSELEKISKASAAENAADARTLLQLFVRIRTTPVPVVAVVRGRALAGGCGLASACDIVLASASARFGYPEVKIGFVPAMVLAILRRNVAEKKAFELLTRGTEIDAHEAKRIGLVNEVFNDEGFDDAVTSYIQSYERTSRSAVRLTKELLYQVDSLAFCDALETGADVNVIARMTEDCQAGIARFLKKD